MRFVFKDLLGRCHVNQGARFDELCDSFETLRFPLRTHAYDPRIAVLFKGQQLVL